MNDVRILKSKVKRSKQFVISFSDCAAHTTNPVPLLFHGRPATIAASGTLRDIAPTMLHLLGLPQPLPMTGRNLLTLIHPG